MAISGQGLASGFSGGFKMMDDYYNRQETQKLNRETANQNNIKATRDTEIYEKGLEKEKVQDVIKSIALSAREGRMPELSDTDYLKKTIGWDLYANMNPEYVAARDSIINGEYNLGSPEFNKASNIVFGDVLNINNSQTDFTTMGKVVPTGQLAHSGVMVQPEVVKGKKILHKKLVGGTYAMGGGVVGSDIEVSYEDADGNVKTYIAPMTQHGKTAGEADMTVGKNVEYFAGKLKGSMMLADGMAPVLKQISNLMVSQGINIPISDVDTSKIATYTKLYENSMTIANNAVKNLFPKATDADTALLFAALKGGGDAPATATIGGKIQKANPEALRIYNENLAKAKIYMGDVESIQAKYSLGDNRNLSVTEGLTPERGNRALTLGELATQVAKESGTQASTDASTEASTDASTVNPTSVAPPRSEVLDQAQIAKDAVGAAPLYQPNQPDPQAGGLSAEVAALKSASQSTDTTGQGSEFTRFEAFPNSNFGMGVVLGNQNIGAVSKVTDDANVIVTMAEEGTLRAWLSSDPNNQVIAGNIVENMRKTYETTGAFDEGSADRLQALINNMGIPIDTPEHYKFQEYQANQQASIAAENQSSTNDEVDYNRAGVIDTEIADMRVALNDPDTMALVRREAARDPYHIDSVEQMLTQINALPRSRKTSQQWFDVFNYWTEVNGPQGMKPSQQPSIIDKWKTGWGFGPSPFDAESPEGLMDLYGKIIGMDRTGTLAEWAKGDNYGDEAIRMKTISDIYQSLNTRKLDPVFMKKFESAISNSLN